MTSIIYRHRDLQIFSVLRAGVRCCLSVPTFSGRSVAATVVDLTLGAVSPTYTIVEDTTTPTTTNTVAVIAHADDGVLGVENWTC